MIPICFGSLCVEVDITFELIAILIAIFGILVIWGEQ